jgi:ubiquinone/menaquinone biosynthesis C-methylase UbiE
LTHYDEQRQFFEDLAGRYDRRWLRARWPRNQQVKAAVIRAALGNALAVGPAVEVGCGTAQIAEQLLTAEPQLEYVGLDLSASMLQVARRRLERFGGRAELREVDGRWVSSAAGMRRHSASTSCTTSRTPRTSSAN